MAFEHWYCEKCKQESTVRYRKGDSFVHVHNLIAEQHGKRSMKCANQHGLTHVRVGFPVKPLFIPLKAEYFDAFRAGTKTVEYRGYGPRWNERTCVVGRAVVLSRGYGPQHRLSGTITGFEKKQMATQEWLAVYGMPGTAACIRIAVAITGVAP